MEDNPWLRIPADDYESHMSDVGQSAVLRNCFARVYAEARPARLAVLGCTTGRDFEQVDPNLTEAAVGVDVNPQYIETARARFRGGNLPLHLIQGDVLEAQLPPGPYDLVHAALLLEYVDPPALLGRIYGWLAPDGTCSLITQEPTPGLPGVSTTRYESLQTLAGRMTLRTSDEVVTLASHAGFSLVSRYPLNLPTGKCLVSTTFKKAKSVAQAATATDEHLPGLPASL